MADVLTQDQIDDLLNNIKLSGDIAVKKDYIGHAYICAYCGGKIFIDDDKMAKNIKMTNNKRNCAHFLIRT